MPAITPRLVHPARAARLMASLAVVALVVALLPGGSPASATDHQHRSFDIVDEHTHRLDTVDHRTGVIPPRAAQQQLAADLGATAIHWNDFGTPHLLVNHGGYLTPPREGTAADVARAFVAEHAELFRLTKEQVEALELLAETPLHDAPDLPRVRDGLAARNPDVAHVVLFRQQFGEVPAAHDGLLAVGVQADGRVASVMSSVTGDEAVTGQQRLSAVEAIHIAAGDVSLDLGALTEVASPTDDFHTFEAESVGDVQRARLRALPTPTDGVRLVWEATLLDGAPSDERGGNPLAVISHVDAETGKLWLRTDRVDHLEDGLASDTSAAVADVGPLTPPRWLAFPTNPNFVDSVNPSADVRELWCWISDSPDCDEEQFNVASRVPWDHRPDLGQPTLTTDGNNASTAISEASFLTPDTVHDRPFSPDRAHEHGWDDAWRRNRCDPTAFSPVTAPIGDTDLDNDEAAAVTNLFVQHNRVHDWAYFKGFTERTFNAQYDNFGNTTPDRGNDPELGSAQAGRRTVFGRDNANQITLQDGIPPITNQYLWQPLAGAFYGTCTDGAYDAAIVLHEYHHLVTNRMIAGPDTGTGDSQGQTESWSDLGFAAYFWEFGLEASPDANRFALAPYVTGNKETGVRNYGMNDSPLNYSGLQYDGNGTTSPHAPGEIWSAVNFDIAEALNARHDDTHPSDDLELQRSCARGQRPAVECPGNVRWAQIMYDAWLIQPADASMVVSRDAMLAADMLRFDGAHQAELWDAFARRGLGATAFSDGVEDTNPSPGWSSPLRDDNGTVAFSVTSTDGGPDPEAAEVYVGVYEARVTPAADTDPETQNTADRLNRDEVEGFVPGTYTAIARADGFGATRFSFTVEPGEDTTVEIAMDRNLASRHTGAIATGDGNPERVAMLIDDTEATNWESLQSEGTASEGKGEGRQVEGRQVTIDLAGREAHLVDRIQVSAALTPEGQSRFSALRSFDVFACDASATASGTCGDADFTLVLASADDAFPAGQPRPLAPDLTLREYDIDDTMATHLRLVVRDNQCTGGPAYQGDQDADPAFHSDCDAEVSTPDRQVLSPPVEEVRAAEFQAFAAATEAGRPTTGRGRPDNPPGRDR